MTTISSIRAAALFAALLFLGLLGCEETSENDPSSDDTLAGERVGEAQNGVCFNNGQCNDHNPCTRDRCIDGVCDNRAQPNPTECRPAAGPCDVAEMCDGTICPADAVMPASTVCRAANGVCDPAEYCSGMTADCPANAVTRNGAACDDGDACTQGDACLSGTCRGGAAVVCAASDQCHDAGVCDHATGACSNPAKPDDADCDDGDACTQKDWCSAGVCTGFNPVVCAASDQCHDAGVCNPASGLCSDPAKPDDADCDDGDACTQQDWCRSGVCTGFNPVICLASDQCHDPGVCDHESGACSNPAKPDDADCDDGDACTQQDWCSAGVCTGFSPVICTPSNECHVAGVCDHGTGACSNPSKADGTACKDGDACTQTDTCQDGVCTGSNPVQCAASDQCHVAGACNPVNGACSNPTAPEGAPCDDGNLCTTADRCSAGQCVAGPPRACAAVNACATATCNPQVGCVSANVNCNDDNECTEDWCAPVIGCMHTPFHPGLTLCSTDCVPNGHCGGDGECHGRRTPECRDAADDDDDDDDDQGEDENNAGGATSIELHDAMIGPIWTPQGPDEDVGAEIESPSAARRSR